MDNASKNATDMISKLQMQYNRGRQAAITNELVDIITGMSHPSPVTVFSPVAYVFAQVQVLCNWARAIRTQKTSRYRTSRSVSWMNVDVGFNQEFILSQQLGLLVILSVNPVAPSRYKQMHMADLE